MTRDGRFTLTETGDLVTLRGYPVLDAGGAPIQAQLLERAKSRSSADGAIQQNGTQVAAFGLYRGELRQRLCPATTTAL